MHGPRLLTLPRDFELTSFQWRDKWYSLQSEVPIHIECRGPLRQLTRTTKVFGYFIRLSFHQQLNNISAVSELRSP